MKYRLAVTFLRGVALLPLPVLYVLADVMWVVLYYIIRYRREVTHRNLQRSFPERTAAEISRLERASYRHLCDIIVETVKMLHISDSQMRRRVDVRGMHLMEQAAAEGRPVFLFIGHFGNWEWVQEVTRRISAPTVCGELYHPLKNPVGDRLMMTIRQRYDTLLIPARQAVRTIIRMKQEHDSFLIGFIADQRPTRKSLHHWTTFLNQDTPYMAGAEEIGRHVDAKYLYLDVEQPRRGHYTMTIEDMDAPDDGEEYPYTRLYLRLLEQNIRRQPEQWLWTHKRWKHQRKENNK